MMAPVQVLPEGERQVVRLREALELLQFRVARYWSLREIETICDAANVEEAIMLYRLSHPESTRTDCAIRDKYIRIRRERRGDPVS